MKSPENPGGAKPSLRRDRKALLVRGEDLNSFESAPFELMRDGWSVVAAGSTKPLHNLSGVRLSTKAFRRLVDVLPSPVAVRVARHPRFALRSQSLLGLERFAAEFDILHAADTHLAYSEQCARIRVDSREKPLVLTCWENIPFLYDDNPVISARKRVVQAATDLFLAVTDEAALALEEEGVDRGKIRVIPPGIDLGRYQGGRPAHDRKKFDIPDSAGVVLYVGRLIREKGVIDLLRAFAHVKAASPSQDLVLLYVGQGPERARLETAAATLGVEDAVRFVDFVPHSDIASVYAMADLFVLPSTNTPYWTEQVGMVLLEAMASGLPVVSTRTGSIPGVVGDAATLVPASDINLLGEAIGDLMSDSNLREQLGERSSQRAQRYDATKVADAITDAYGTIWSPG